MTDTISFEEVLMQHVKNKMISDIKKAEFLKFDYGSRMSVPNGFVNKIWNTIGWDEVLEQLRPAIQTRICNTLIGAMETEVKTDVKKLLGVAGVREKLRMEVYPKLMQVLEGEDSC